MALIVSNNNKLNPINSEGISESEMVSLNIENTTLSEINFVSKLGRLRELYAAHNRIESFDVQSMTGSKELTYISLQSNPLKFVSIRRVREILPNLTVLDISNSAIETDCRALLELYNEANDKSLNLNINTKTLSGCWVSELDKLLCCLLPKTRPAQLHDSKSS